MMPASNGQFQGVTEVAAWASAVVVLLNMALEDFFLLLERRPERGEVLFGFDVLSRFLGE